MISKTVTSFSDEMITIQEALLLFDINKSTLNTLREYSGLKSYRQGRNIYFHKEELANKLERYNSLLGAIRQELIKRRRDSRKK